VGTGEQVCVIHLVEPANVIRKLVYVATNPVKDRLVEKVRHWPGVNGLAALLDGRTLEPTRPHHFFRPAGPMPAAVTLTFVLPPELGDSQQLRAELRAQVAAMEAAVAAERMRTGARVLGRRMILRQSWRACPASHEPRRNLRPRLAARNHWARIEAIQRNREFLAAYRDARRCWLAGDPIPFPVGTYWLRRFAHVPLTI
jgi:hypothetical protein